METKKTDKKLEIYDKVRSVPKKAQKAIQGGRLKGFTDINPMWRIKTLTELFGPVGFGWKYKVIRQDIQKFDTGEVAVFVDIELQYKQDGEWSEPIFGTGGNMMVSKEKSGLRVSDECFKMAVTDALSVACKSLGVGADIYWIGDDTKYTNPESEEVEETTDGEQTITEQQGKRLFGIAYSVGKDANHVKENIIRAFGKNHTDQLTISEYERIAKWYEQGCPAKGKKA